MEPLIALVLVTSALLIAGRLRSSSPIELPVALRGGLAVMFVLTGGAHFVGMREEMIEMVPPLFPAPELLITLTGVAEIVCAIGLLVPATATLSAGVLTLMLIAMFPANVYAAVEGITTAWYDEVVPRTVMQAIFLTATGTVLRAGLRGRGRRMRPAQRAPAAVAARAGR